MSSGVAYARLSKDRAGDELGVSRQLEDIRKLAELRGLHIVAERVDNDTSADGTKQRKGFDAVLDDVEQGRAHVVVAWSLDRLTRNRRDTVRLIEACQRADASIVLVRGSDMDLSTPAGRLAADILASVARHEIEAKSDRQRRAGRQRAEAGKPPVRRAFGYNDDGSKHSDEAPIVERIFRDYLVGASITGIAKQLNAAGVTTVLRPAAQHRGDPGRAWDDTTVRALLTNPRYMAERTYRGQRVGPGNWPAIVAPDTFEAVQSKLRSGPERRQARRWLGSALFRCWCGAVATTSYDKDAKRIYRCSVSGHMRRRAEPVDDFIRQMIVARLRRGDVVDALAATGRPDVDVAALRHESIAKRAKIDQLASDWAREALTDRQVQVATRELEAEIQRIESQLADAGRESVLGDLAIAPDPGQAWLDSPLDRQRAVLDAVAIVTILPGRPGRLPFDPATVDVDFERRAQRTRKR